MEKLITIKQMASAGGHARAKKLTKKRASAIARQAANARWRKEKNKIAKDKKQTRKEPNKQNNENTGTGND